MLPPFSEPTGPLLEDAEVLAGYVGGAGPTGFSARFHVERPVLYASRTIAVALQVGPGTFLVRIDVPDGAEDARRVVGDTFATLGLSLFDEDTLFAAPVAIQVLGIRLSSWDLWGRDIDVAFADLRQAAAGPGAEPVLGGA
ncbi:MAG: hypothetical protein LC792_16395 [Actinobacteria bacterium]|nr:hypothetical protein [Actinomycetota bacterium]